MGKFVTFLLGFGVLIYMGYHFLYGRVGPDGSPEAPKATLDRVQEKADQIEADMKKRAE